ncbi:MAG: FG-GAP-like repeat-containing protein [Bacteroidota bacterium]
MTVLIGLVVLVFSARAQITSNFSTDADGWAIGDLSGGSAQTITYSSSGGNPGGYISLTTGNPNPFYWFAPAKFLGNRAYTSFGEALTFDVRTTATAIDHTGSGDIMIINNSNVSIYANFTVLPGAPGTWTTMSIMLDETGNWKNSNISGSAASRAQVIDVLTSIQAIRINFAWKAYPTNGITGSLDNVVMGTHPATPPAPSITSLSAKAAVRGTNITITGSNFGANATSNVVWFGDVKGNIVTASSTSITVTVPVAADYAPIMVLNTTTQLSTLSRQKFAPTFPSNGGGQLYKGSFLSDIVYNRSVGYISHGDLNGDGKPEMFASQGTQISIYENVSTPGSITTSSFATRIDLNPTLAAGYYEIHNDDLDGDGKPDVFFALRDNPDQGRVGVLRNIHTSGPISAASFDTYQEYNFPVYTAVTAMSADLDGDGKPEILGWGGSCAPSPLYILQNISVVGEIRFTSAYSITGATSCQGRFEVADLDGDGKLDVVQSTGNETRIFRNLSVPGTISFAAGFDMGNGGNIASIGDLDNDGKPEIVYANGGMKIFKNVSTAGTLTSASFQGPTIFANGTNVAKIADVNGDGKPDVVVGGGSAMGVYQNVTPDGVINTSSFLPIVPIDVTNLPTEIDVFDVDADGYPDVVSNSANLIQINRNTVTIAPTITNINPKSGTPGSTLTITGTNFSTVATDNTLYFGAAKATVTNATSTSLTVTVPLGATFDQISLSLRGYNVFSPQFFTPTFSGGSPFAASSMAAPFDITNGTTSTGLSVMDYDGDGKVDVLVDNAGSVNALRNIGNTGVIDATTFAAPYAVTNQGQAIRGVDIDGDGKLDLTTPGYIWRNISNPALPNPIAFDASVTRDGSTVTRFAPPRDLNGDGRVDMIYTTSGTNITYVQNESRAGGFAANSTTMSSFLSIVTQPKPSSGGYCAAADFDGDGFNDLVATNPNTDNFSAFISAGQTGNLTTASFSAGKLFAAGDVPAGLAVLDFDGDGKLDVAIANSVNSSTTTISLYRNVSTIGSIDFQRQDFQAALGPTDIVAADIDGDGKPDLVTTNVNSNSFSIFRNTSTTGVINTSSFAAKVDYPIASQPRGLSVADIDNDTRPDIIVTRATNIVSIFKNLVPLGPIISFSQQPVNKTACENGTVTFSVAATGASNLTYNWQLFNSGTGSFSDLSANANYSGVNTATLTVTAITAGMNGNIYRCRVNGTGASEKNSDQATLTTSVSPSPPLTSGATSCKGSSLTLTAGGSIDGNYRWFDSPTASQPINGEVNSNFATPVIFSTTTFYAAIANANGCLSTKTAAVATIAPLTKPAISSNGTLLCGVNVVTIKGPAGFSTYNWSNGESTQNIDVSFTGSYSLIVQDANGCQSLASDAITITAGSVPKPVIDANKTRLCSAGDQVILTAPAGFSAYEWSNGETTQTLVVTDAGTFNVRVTNSSGCRSETSDDITVDLGAEKPSISVGKNVLVSTPAKTYQWSYGEIAIPGATSQFLDYNPFQYGTYAVSVTDFSDCAATSDVFVNLVTAVEDEIVQAVVYPNPFIDVIELDADEAQLLDATGKHVQHLQRGKNDASQLSRGLYIVITGSKKIKISK